MAKAGDEKMTLTDAHESFNVAAGPLTRRNAQGLLLEELCDGLWRRAERRQRREMSEARDLLFRAATVLLGQFYQAEEVAPALRVMLEENRAPDGHLERLFRDEVSKLFVDGASLKHLVRSVNLDGADLELDLSKAPEG